MEPLRYRIEELIGQGGYGQVFRARLHDGRAVAVKRVAPDRAEPHHRASLLREARLATKLDHPNIVSIIGVNEEHTGHVALVMELVDGIDLACLLRATRVPLASAIYITRSLLAALAHAHETARLVHRDLSPHNVLVSWSGDIKLTDFGLARPSGLGPTQPGCAPGKPRYMSPEQFLGQPVDSRADLFSLGMVLHQMLAGCMPYDDGSDHVLAFMNGQIELVPLAVRCPELPAELCALVDRLLAPLPSERYSSAQEALVELPEWRHGRKELVTLLEQLRRSGALSRRESRAARRKRRQRRFAAALVFGAVLGAGGLMLHGRLTETNEVISDEHDDAPAHRALDIAEEPD